MITQSSQACAFNGYRYSKNGNIITQDSFCGINYNVEENDIIELYICGTTTTQSSGAYPGSITIKAVLHK